MSRSKFHILHEGIGSSKILSVVFVMELFVIPIRLSLIYWGLELIVNGGIGCCIILSYTQSFLALVMLLVYFRSSVSVVGYTFAVVTKEYVES